MKSIYLNLQTKLVMGIFLILLYSVSSSAQVQLEVSGPTTSSIAPVVFIQTQANSGDLIGLQVVSVSSSTAIGGAFTGSKYGIASQSLSGVGVVGTSETGYAGYFRNVSKTMPDLVIGGNGNNNPGDDCVIASDPNLPGSDLFLRANDAVVLQLDHDDNESGQLEVRNGIDGVVYLLTESGKSYLNGKQAVMELTSTDHFSGSVLELNNVSPIYKYIGAINFKNSSNTPGQIAYNANHTMDFRVHYINPLMPLSDGINHIIMSNGAKLTSGGMWMDVSSKTKKNLEKKVNSQNILTALTQLPMYHWRYKTEPQSLHIGPTAEDFYAMFNLGSDDQSLSPSDLAGTAVASVQALHGENITLRNEIAVLKKEYRF